MVRGLIAREKIAKLPWAEGANETCKNADEMRNWKICRKLRPCYDKIPPSEIAAQLLLARKLSGFALRGGSQHTAWSEWSHGSGDFSRV